MFVNNHKYAPMIQFITGDIFEQDVDVIVNPWNQNFIPWWLLIPKGVSGQLKKKAGYQPFQELGYRPIHLGKARLTSAGRLKYKGIIHVAGINIFWFATKYSILESLKSSILICERQNFKSIAIPLIGSGTGNFNSEKVEKLFAEYFTNHPTTIDVKVVKYDRK